MSDVTPLVVYHGWSNWNEIPSPGRADAAVVIGNRVVVPIARVEVHVATRGKRPGSRVHPSELREVARRRAVARGS